MEEEKRDALSGKREFSYITPASGAPMTKRAETGAQSMVEKEKPLLTFAKGGDSMAKNERFPYPGAIDADGHILEPPDTWEKYIDPPYRDRAIRITKDRDGLEILEIGGGPSSSSTSSAAQKVNANRCAMAMPNGCFSRDGNRISSLAGHRRIKGTGPRHVRTAYRGVDLSKANLTGSAMAAGRRPSRRRSGPGM